MFSRTNHRLSSNWLILRMCCILDCCIHYHFSHEQYILKRIRWIQHVYEISWFVVWIINIIFIPCIIHSIHVATVLSRKICMHEVAAQISTFMILLLWITSMQISWYEINVACDKRCIRNHSILIIIIFRDTFQTFVNPRYFLWFIWYFAILFYFVFNM